MKPATVPPLRVGLRCDASPAVGVGHVVRCLALSDELRQRGWETAIFGSVVDVPWLLRALADRDVHLFPASQDPRTMTRDVAQWGGSAMVLDGYSLPHGLGAELQSAGITVLALQDGPFGAGQAADLILDQNAGAETTTTAKSSILLTGLRYALFRDEILQQRQAMRKSEAAPQVLVFAGGTDPYSAAPDLTAMILATGVPLAVTTVAYGQVAREAIAGLGCEAGQSVRVIAPTPSLAEHAAASDLAVVAAGSSVWELLCMGVPCAVVAVADNQRPTISVVNREDIAAGLGTLEELRAHGEIRDNAINRLTRLLSSSTERTQLAQRARRSVDGQGRSRVADALAAQIHLRHNHNDPRTVQEDIS